MIIVDTSKLLTNQIDSIVTTIKKEKIHRLSAKIIIAINDFVKIEQIDKKFEQIDKLIIVPLMLSIMCDLSLYRVSFCNNYIKINEINNNLLICRYYYLHQILLNCPDIVLVYLYENTCVTKEFINFIIKLLFSKLEENNTIINGMENEQTKNIDFWWLN